MLVKSAGVLWWSGFVVTTVVAAVFSASCSSPTSPSPAPASPPTLACPVDVAAQSANGDAVTVSYTAPAVTGGSQPVSVTCTPASGNFFSVGTTPVTCRVTDALGRDATCSFSVGVTRTPRLSASTFVAFGDSMTDGVIAMNAPHFSLVGSPVSYPAQLQTLLATRYSAQTITVYNEGLDGETTSAGLLRLPGVLSTDHPDVTLLMEGANDINGESDTAVETIRDNMSQMIGVSRSRGALVYLATLPPERAGGYRVVAPDLVPVVNQQLAGLAGVSGVVLVDIYAAFGGVATDDLIGPDGLHPTAAGYQLIAQTFYNSIVKALEIQTSVKAVSRKR